jgi:hypothetical protein
VCFNCSELDVEAKIKAHRRAGFAVPGSKALSDLQWQQLRAWVDQNPDAKFRRYEAIGSKVFYSYSRSSIGGLFFTSVSKIKGYNERKRPANAHLKRYRKALGNDRDTRFKVWAAANRSSAKGRGLVHDLSRDELLEFFEKPCFFCGETPAEDKTWGIDRLQNKLGYTYDNCVPCCITCNYAKGTSDLHDFLDRVHIISKKFL